MDKKRKRSWTPDTAIVYIAKVQGGKAPVGLKYCSAYDFIRKLSAKAIVKRAEST